MPIYTFVCGGCGATAEAICKADERAEQKLLCQDADCPQFGSVMTWRGVETPMLRPDGKYEFKAILGNGRKVPVVHHGPKRSDE